MGIHTHKKGKINNMPLTLSKTFLWIGTKTFKVLLKSRGKQCIIKSRQALELAPPFSGINFDKLFNLFKLGFLHLYKRNTNVYLIQGLL